MAKAAERLSLFGDGSSVADPPTADHLPPENSAREQPSQAKSVKENGPKAGSFEKLNAMFGGVGTMFALPASRG